MFDVPRVPDDKLYWVNKELDNNLIFFLIMLIEYWCINIDVRIKQFPQYWSPANTTTLPQGFLLCLYSEYISSLLLTFAVCLSAGLREQGTSTNTLIM